MKIIKFPKAVKGCWTFLQTDFIKVQFFIDYGPKIFIWLHSFYFVTLEKVLKPDIIGLLNKAQ